jgi:hypothetical protein
MKNWWEQYGFVGDVIHLANFTEEEFTDRIPYDIQVGVDKITVAESAEWSKYFDKYGVWPSVNQWKKAREIKARQMEDFEKMLLSCNKEEHY